MNPRLRHPIGWLLNSVQYRAAREVDIWLKSNAYQLETRYNHFHALLVRLGSLPLLGAVVFGLIEIVLLLLAVKLSWQMRTWGPGILDSYNGILSHFMTVWEIQAIVAALTFPIVVAFVTFLFGTKELGGRRQYVYLFDSCAMFVGVSSLALVLAMAIQDVLLWQRDRQELQWMLFLDIIWLWLNLAGTIYFLFRSFQFVLPLHRRRIVTQYIVTVMWPQEAQRLYKNYALMSSSVDEGLMRHGKGFIYIGGLWKKHGEVAVSKYFATRRYLSDVYLRPLDWAVALWRSTLANLDQVEKKQGLLGKEPRLLFPVAFGTRFDGETSLCRFVGSDKPGFMSRLLIRLSFRFVHRSPDENFDSVEDFITELQSDIIDALNTRRYQVFEERYQALIEFLGNVLEASEYTGESGQKGNFALLPLNPLTSDFLYQRWLRVNYVIAEACVATLKDSPYYFRFMSHVPVRLLYRTHQLSQIEFSRDVIALGLSVFTQLGTWWTRTVEEQGVVEHDKCKPAVLRPPYFARYAEVLNVLVGAYESMRNYQLPRPDNASFEDWEVAQTNTQLYTTHLEQILLMMSHAVGRGDTSGAEAAVDMLQRWEGPLHLRMRGLLFSPRGSWLITVHDVTRNSIEKVKEMAVTADQFRQYKGREAGMFVAIALHNLWSDAVCVAVYTLLQWGVGCECENSLPAKLAGNLVRGNAVADKGAPSGPLNGVRSRADLLKAIIRQQSSESSLGLDTYNGLLSSFYQKIHRVNEPPMIAGRIYSGWGAPDLNSTQDGQLLYLMMLPGNPWHPEVEFKDYIENLVADDPDVASNLHTYFKSLIERLGSSDFDKYTGVFNCIRNTPKAEDFGSVRDALKAPLEAFSRLFDQQLDEAVVDAAIDPERLVTVARYAASLGFGKKDGVAPLTLFREVQYSADVTDEFTLTINGVDKGEFVRPLRKQLAANEEEFYAESVRSGVAFNLMQNVISRLQLQLVDASTPEQYWSEFMRIVNEIRERHLHPLLLLENRVVPRWVWDWILVHRIGDVWVPEDLRVVKDPSQREEAGYEATFNDVPVYQAPLPSGSSVLLPAEIFDKITFRTYEGYGCVRPDWKPVPDKPTKINLKLMWGYNIEFDANLRGLASRLVYGKTKGGD